MRRMLKRQRLQLVKRMLNSRNTQHTMREIAHLAGVHPSQITRDVADLRKAGHIR